MKKVLFLIIAVSLVLGLTAALQAGVTNPGVKDTPHDVQVITGETGLEPCAMCHTPHSGGGTAPLWNREQGAQTYTMYSSASFDMASGSSTVNAPSSLCLVCHNGVFSSLVNYPGPGSHAGEDYDFEMNPTFWAMLDTDLQNEHPISFSYVPSMDNTQDNNGFPGTFTCTTGTNDRLWVPSRDSNSAVYPLYGAVPNGNSFECATCHAVHDTVNYYGKQLTGGKSVGTQVFFLRHTNEGSAMCADCHVNRYFGNF